MYKNTTTLPDIAAKVVKERKEAKQSQLRKDVLQFLIDAEDIDNGRDCKLTEKEIISTALVVILSGVLHHFTYTSYLLALHPHVQDRLINEIKEYFDGNPEATLLEAAENIEYIDMILHEVFRLYPGINMLSRVCSKTCVVGDGLVIPKDTVVYIPIHNLHHNPKYWVEPEQFQPNRFSRNADVPYDPFAFLPFGEGPRMCPGKQLAYLKLKMAIINILKDYKFVRAADTEVPLVVENHFQVCPIRHVKLAIEKI